MAPVSNPFTPLVRDQDIHTRTGPIRREHPWAVAAGAVLFIAGLALEWLRV